MTVKEKVTSINKKHEAGKQVAMPVSQTVLCYEDYDDDEYCEDDDTSVVYLNCATLQQSSTSIYDVADKTKSIKYIWDDHKKQLKGYCFSYDEELDMIIAFIGSIDISLPLCGEPTNWEEEDRFYVDRDKNVYAMLKDGSYGLVGLHTNEVVHQFNKLKESDCICPCVSCDATPNHPDLEPLWRVFPKVIACGNGRSYVFSSKQDFIFYLEQVKAGHNDSFGFLKYNLQDKQAYTDDAAREVERILENINDIIPSEYTCRAKFFAMERVECEDPVACIRAFVLTKGPEMHEIHRFYFTDRDMFFYESDNMGSFRCAFSFFKNKKYWEDINLIGYDKETVSGTILERLDSVMDFVPDMKKGYCIWAMLEEELLEKLWKAGYRKYVSFLLDSSIYAADLMVSHSFGSINRNRKSIYGMLGMNRHQTDILLDKIVKTGDWRLVIKMKCVLSGTMYLNDSALAPAMLKDVSISGIDRGTFDSVMGLFDEMYRMEEEFKDINEYDQCEMIKRMINCASKISEIWGPQILIRSKESLMSLCLHGFEQARRNGLPDKAFYDSPFGMIQQYYDYLRMIEDDDTGRFKPYFSHIDEVSMLHDLAVESYNIRKDAEAVAKIEAAVKRVEKFAYENDAYCIVVPTCAEDFTKEGNKLGHCVESYFNRVADGETNIMFIRKKSAPDKPFFTVEISDNGTIEQIHGFSNRNLDTEPDLIPFIREWQDKRGVVLRNIDKVR